MTDLKHLLEDRGNKIAQEICDLLLRTCREQNDIPVELHSTLAKATCRSITLNVMNSLDIVREVEWFETYEETQT